MAVYDVSPYVGRGSYQGGVAGIGRGRGTGNGFSLSADQAARAALQSGPWMGIPGVSIAVGALGAIPARFSGGASGSNVAGTGAGYRDPYGTATAAAQATAGIPRTATADDYQQFLADTLAGIPPGEGELGYIGGYPSNFIYKTDVPADPKWGAGRLEGGAPRSYSASLYSRPLYRDNAAYGYLAGLGADAVRGWQAFFTGLGFKAGPSGQVSQPLLDAMTAFMKMANGIPGGMKVETLRDRVMDQVRSGMYFFRGVNEQGDLLPLALDEGDLLAEDILAGGGGGAGQTGPGFTEPYTETVTRNIVQEFSMDQGMMALRNYVSQQIGRAPSEEEVREYVRQLNSAFRADPTTITQVTTVDPVTGESETDITEDETGVEPEARALSFSESVSPEERREYQAGRYFDAIMAEIGL